MILRISIVSDLFGFHVDFQNCTNNKTYFLPCQIKKPPLLGGCGDFFCKTTQKTPPKKAEEMGIWKKTRWEFQKSHTQLKKSLANPWIEFLRFSLKGVGGYTPGSTNIAGWKMDPD